MVEDHILDGDHVVVDPVQTVDDGDVAVVLLEDGTATLKRVYREQGRIRLQPANSTMQPLYVKKLRIQGRVCGVVRWF
jgi:repressor LexA